MCWLAAIMFAQLSIRWLNRQCEVQTFPLTLHLLFQGEEADWLGHRHLLAHRRGVTCRSVGECSAHHTQLCKYYKTYCMSHHDSSDNKHRILILILCLIDRWGRPSSHWPSVTSAESCCSRVSAVRPAATSSTSAAALRFLSCVSTTTS